MLRSNRKLDFPLRFKTKITNFNRLSIHMVMHFQRFDEIIFLLRNKTFRIGNVSCVCIISQITRVIC